MTKVRVEDLKVFRTVADVIGDEMAKLELKKLQDVDCGFCDDDRLWAAFVWYETPHGHCFWENISCGANPYAQ